MGRKERILDIIKENKITGITVDNLFKQYNKDFPDNIIEKKDTLYGYLQRLKGYDVRSKSYDKPILVKAESSTGTGKAFIYKPTALALSQESDDLNTTLIDNLVDLMVKVGANSEEHGIDILEKQIQPSIKRLTESGRLG